MEEDIKKELEYLIKNSEKMVKINESDRVYHLIALGNLMSLKTLEYSIKYNSWLYKKEETKNEEEN